MYVDKIISYKMLNIEQLNELSMEEGSKTSRDDSLDTVNKRLKTETNTINHDLEEMIHRLIRKYNEAELNLSNPDLQVKEYCIKIRRKIQLDKELKIEKINQQGDELINEVDKFEKEILNSHLNLNKNELDKKLNDMKLLIDDLSNKNSQYLKLVESKFDLDVNKINKILFNNKMIEYKLTKQNFSFGDVISYEYDSIDYNQLERIDLVNYFHDYFIDYYEDYKKDPRKISIEKFQYITVISLCSHHMVSTI